MKDSILTDIKIIDNGLETLHSEGARLRSLQQQHDDDIKKRNEGVEAEYASTPASLAESDKLIESDYQKQMVSGTDA